jgi:hypothetical protein
MDHKHAMVTAPVSAAAVYWVIGGGFCLGLLALLVR